MVYITINSSEVRYVNRYDDDMLKKVVSYYEFIILNYYFDIDRYSNTYYYILHRYYIYIYIIHTRFVFFYLILFMTYAHQIVFH